MIINMLIIKLQALEENVVPIICSVLEVDGMSENSKAAMHSLPTLEMFNDAGIQFLDERLCKILFEILSKPVLSELSGVCLELVHGLAENGS